MMMNLFWKEKMKVVMMILNVTKNIYLKALSLIYN